MKFLDVKTDYAFKKVFGSIENKSLLIQFLNSLIEFKNNQKISDLTIVDPYNIPMLKGMKDTYVDVKAVLENGEKVIIEMQVLNHNGFEKRVLYNAAKNYSVQLTSSDNYELLNPVIALTLVDFEMFPESDKYINSFKLLEKEKFINYSDDIELIFVELPKFNKSFEEVDKSKNIQDKWIYFIKNAGSLEFQPKNWNSEFETAFTTINEANLSLSELEIQHKRKEFIYIQRSSIELATQTGLDLGMKQGLRKGLEQGIEQGQQQAQEKIIKKLQKNMNISYDEAVKLLSE